MKNKHFSKYILAMLIFGTNGVIASQIPLPGAEIVLTRTILGSVCLALLFLILKNKPNITQMKRQWKWMLFSGASMALSWVCLFEAYQKANVSVATLEYYCGPVIVMALSPIVFKEKLTPVKITGITLVVIGMVFINKEGFTSVGSSAGLMYGLFSAVFYSSMVISNKRIKNLTGLDLTLAQLVIAGILVAPYVWLTRTGGVVLGPQAVVAIIFLGIVNTGFACFLYFSSIHDLPAQTVGLCSYIDPLVTLLLSSLFLGERMSGLQTAGAVLILGGAAFGEFFSGYFTSKEEFS